MHLSGQYRTEIYDAWLYSDHRDSESTPGNPVFENFIKATEHYENFTNKYYQTTTNAENLHRQIADNEKLIRDIKE